MFTCISSFLSALLQAVRALMIVGIVLGAIGCLIAIFALKCLKMGNMEDNIKATMTLAAGIMFLLAGVVNTLFTVPASFIEVKQFCPNSMMLNCRCVWHCWGVGFCQPDRAKFSVHYVRWWWVQHVWRSRCRWTHRDSDSKVKNCNL